MNQAFKFVSTSTSNLLEARPIFYKIGDGWGGKSQRARGSLSNERPRDESAPNVAGLVTIQTGWEFDPGFKFVSTSTNKSLEARPIFYKIGYGRLGKPQRDRGSLSNERLTDDSAPNVAGLVTIQTGWEFDQGFKFVSTSTSNLLEAHPIFYKIGYGYLFKAVCLLWQ